MDSLTQKQVDSIRHQIAALPDDPSAEQIERTAHHLETIAYQPILLVEPPDFLRTTKAALLSFIDQLTTDRGKHDLTEQHLSLLLHHFKLLQRLRKDDPEAWDEVAEVTEED